MWCGGNASRSVCGLLRLLPYGLPRNDDRERGLWIASVIAMTIKISLYIFEASFILLLSAEVPIGLSTALTYLSLIEVRELVDIY